MPGGGDYRFGFRPEFYAEKLSQGGNFDGKN